MKRFVMLALLTFPFAASAAVIPVYDAPLEIQAVPEAVRPGEMVVLTAIAPSGNTNGITFTWTVAGKTIEQGLGKSSVGVIAGTSGSVTEVTVSANENGIDRGLAAYTIAPASIDLLWEGRTTVPPFSGILPLPNGGTEIAFLAIPNVKEGAVTLSPQSLVYTWHINNGQAPAARGVGMSSFVTIPPRLGGSFTVSVTAASSDGVARAATSVVVTPVEPQILAYEATPLLGVRFDRALGNSFRLATDEITVKAYPLYAALSGTASYGWTVNGESVSSGADPTAVTLRKTGAGSGIYTLGFSLANSRNFFEQARRAFTISF